MNRSRILGRLLEAQGTGIALPDPLPHPSPIADRVERFRVEAERVGTTVLSGTALDRALSRILAEAEADRICWLGMDLFSRHGIPVRFDGSANSSGGALLISNHPDRRVELPLRPTAEPYDLGLLAEVPVSVGTADWGVSETGTTVESSLRESGRVGAILPPVHVVLLREADLLGHHAELFSKLDLRPGASTRILMTGPSRTADIEKILILGVHGPKRLYVVFTE